ncbi:hypothetical protein NKJ73_32915, partial [Mesorhizobium sp. M0074]|uniref:glycine cleavage T C-terminal barrel domain-containing protein n=1 Tax=Mesorhizobium sp. M0074 TaxID=2956869 RepID=UPI00333B1E82
SIGHGTSPSTGIGDRNVTTVPWPLAPQSKRRSLSKTFCRTFSTLSGQTTAAMVGLGSMVSQKKDSIGAVMSRREGLAGDKRRLVGLQPLDPAGKVVSGSHLFAEDAPRSLDTDQGWITSACYSPHVGSMIGL